MSSTAVTCSACGRQLEIDLQQASSVVRTDTRRDLRDLLEGRLDSVGCEACGAALPVARDLIVKGTGWQERRARHGGEADLLRAAVRVRLAVHLDGVVVAILSAETAAAAWQVVHERWRELTAEAINAALLASEGLLGSVPLSDPDHRLGAAQALALFEVAAFAGQHDDVDLEAAVKPYAAPQLVLGGALERLTQFTVQAGDQLERPLDRYILLAVHALAVHASGIGDPLARDWAVSWTAFEWSMAEDADSWARPSLRLSPQTASAVLDSRELADIAVQVMRADPRHLERLQEIYDRIGLGRLIADVGSTGAGLPPNAPFELVCAVLDAYANDAPGLPGLAMALRMFLGSLQVAERFEEADALVDRALGLSDGGPDSRAVLLAIYGAMLKDARRPQAFLQRVGDQPAEWEHALKDPSKAALWTERSNALRLLGRSHDARDMLEDVLGLDLDPENRWLTERNLAIVLRETGQADRAAALLEDLLTRCPAPEHLFGVLQALAGTYQFLGDGPRAREAIVRALGERGPRDDLMTLRAGLAAEMAAAGEQEDALALIRELHDQPPVPRATLSTGAAVAALLERGAPVEQDITDKTVAQLRATRQTAAAAGDRMVELNALRVLGAIADSLDDDAEPLWRELVEIRDATGAEDPFELVQLARHRYARGDRAEGVRLLRRVPGALADELGGVADLSTVLDATARLNRALRRIGTTLTQMSALHTADARLLAELQRDAIGRARAPISEYAPLAAGLTDDELARLVPPAGTLHVLEWLRSERGLHGQLTRITVAGSVTTVALPAPDVSVTETAARVRARLDGWRPGRRGDPLDLADWFGIEQWLQRQMTGATDQDHLVVIDHEALWGLPWHAVRDAGWTTSYAPGWAALLSMAARNDRRRATFGVLSVAALGDSRYVREAFQRSLSRSSRLAKAHDLTLLTAEGGDGDREALTALLNDVDILKLQCHGLVDREDRELALMIAADGTLPPQHAVAASSDAEREHRFSWRDAQHVPTAPALVTSAACSTGASLLAGLGERLGLYGALRRRGTRSVVAPAWDAVAADVLEIIDDVLDRSLGGEQSLAACVKAASDQAAQRLPRWRSHVLSIEGDWR